MPPSKSLIQLFLIGVEDSLRGRCISHQRESHEEKLQKGSLYDGFYSNGAGQIFASAESGDYYSERSANDYKNPYSKDKKTIRKVF